MKKKLPILLFHASAQRASSLYFIYLTTAALPGRYLEDTPTSVGGGLFFFFQAPKGIYFYLLTNKLLLKYFSQFDWLDFKTTKSWVQVQEKNIALFSVKKSFAAEQKAIRPGLTTLFQECDTRSTNLRTTNYKTLTKVLRHLQHLILWIFWAHEKRKQVDLE